MVLLRPALDHSRHGRCRRQAIFRAVVRSHLAELGDGVHRGHHVRTAGAATVAALAAVKQVEIVALAHAVETYVGIATYRRGNLKVPLAAGSSRRERDQRVHAAPIGRQLSELLSADDVADFAGIGLHGDGSGLDGNLFLRAADRQLEINTSTIAHLQSNVLLLGGLEAGRSGANRIASDAKIGHHELTVATGIDRARQTGVEVGDCDGCVCDGSTGRIRYGSNDGGL